ncbi:hypothetical protein [Ancylomarina sp. 16SWW S1-10-2]|uniref:hypothetical protein n=1 Tax=Ancylomarina sp. 16SWW S1-10-2 TaxID=2499681 RepID=UPI0012AE835E|nr:hypothetical protein [Ancylomarina sp. 16SWW S1-10-2]MRT91915.1 hypothetical protein [Ancylomarina sp. 16SWW S1-10-2]
MLKGFARQKQYVIVCFFVVISLNCFADKKQNENNKSQSSYLVVPEKWMDAIDSRHHYSMGVDRESQWGGMLGFEGMYDVRIHPKFTLGVYGGVAFKDADWNKTTQILTGFRMSYFPWGLGLIRMSRLEPYVCLAGGLNIEEKRDDFYKLEYAAHVGARYRIATNWAVYAELGSGAAFGLTFMMR